jgi:hypothetical protein
VGYDAGKGCPPVLKEVRRLFPLHRIVAGGASAETSSASAASTAPSSRSPGSGS